MARWNCFNYDPTAPVLTDSAGNYLGHVQKIEIRSPIGIDRYGNLIFANMPPVPPPDKLPCEICGQPSYGIYRKALTYDMFSGGVPVGRISVVMYQEPLCQFHADRDVALVEKHAERFRRQGFGTID